MGLEKPHIKGLADITASILPIRNVNTSEIASVLPRDVMIGKKAKTAILHTKK